MERTIHLDLRGKVAVVTGGAHGIGLCVCQLLRQCGASVCTIDLKENDKNDLLTVLVSAPDNAELQNMMEFVEEYLSVE